MNEWSRINDYDGINDRCFSNPGWYWVSQIESEWAGDCDTVVVATHKDRLLEKLRQEIAEKTKELAEVELITQSEHKPK